MGTKLTLHDALTPEHEPELIQALRKQQNLSCVSYAGKSLYRLALENGLVDLVKLCQLSGVAVFPPLDKSRTILHFAVEQQRVSLVQTLLKQSSVYGDLKDTVDDQGQTPLHLAVSLGNPELVALLLKFNATQTVSDCFGNKPIDLALALKGPHALEILEQLSVTDRMAKVPSETSQDSTLLPTDEVADKPCVDEHIPVICSSDLQFGDVISKGSSCTVYRGQWRGSVIAIKQFSAEYSNSQKQTDKFIKEAEVLASLRHPNLLLLMGVVVDQPPLCLVTEYVPKCSLFHAIHKLSLTLRERFSIAVQLCKGLTYLHSQAVVHRDLKPENCLLDEGLQVKIADFGLARPLAGFRSALTTVCIGTSRFMAPELFDQQSEVGTEVDIWALGCVLIELFSGKRPWHYIASNKTNCILYEIFNRKPVPVPQSILPELRQLVQDCCQYTPQTRPSAQQVLIRLEALRLLYPTH